MLNESVKPAEGFKFDICERIRLSRNEHEILSIESTELKPIVSTILDGVNVEIIGSLILNIEYTSVVVSEISFTHSIPVEIRIPANRFTNIDCFEASIVNFNVEQVGSYVLNLTGVLSISEVEPEIQTDKSQEQILTEEGLKLKERAFSTGVMPTWEFDQIIASHRTLNSRNAKLVHENDELMAENAKLVVLLMQTLPYIEPEIEQTGYGFFPGGNPTLFMPDSDNTEKEKENWEKACELWNESKVEAAGSHVDLVNDKGDYIGHATIANLGMGMYTYENEEAKYIYNQIKTLEELKHDQPIPNNQ